MKNAYDANTGSIQSVKEENFSFFIIEDEQNIVVAKDQYMFSLMLEIIDGSIEVNGILEIR